MSSIGKKKAGVRMPYGGPDKGQYTTDALLQDFKKRMDERRRKVQGDNPPVIFLGRIN